MISNCEICDRPFRTYPALLKRGGGRFCSYECCGKYRSKECVGEKSGNWKGGITKNMTSYMFAYRKKRINKIKAKNNVNNFIRDKKIEREPCLICGNAKSEGHHPDYNKPLDVLWLCRKCHGLLHLVIKLHYEIKESA